jgi:hypothetical protein
VDAIQPSRVMVGHLRRACQRSCDLAMAPVQVTGLGRDSRLRNFATLGTSRCSGSYPNSGLVRWRVGPLQSDVACAVRGSGFALSLTNCPRKACYSIRIPA